MARMSKYEARHIRNVEAYKREVQKIFDEATKEALRMGIRFDADTGKPFSFDDYPATKRKFEALMAKMHQRLMAVVRNGVDAEYELAQDSAGAQIRSVFPALSVAQISEQLRKLANSNAKAAFEQRRKRGLGLSDKVWQYTGQYKQELEMALDIGIGEGKSAQALSRDVRKYLRQPNMLFRKVRDKHGVLHLSKRAKAYHPGRGVYRSSAKNALRMVATETNIAYRSADYLNTKASPWIVGIRIVLSNNHTCKDSQGVAQPFTDICDKLAGRYPKDFKFTGWHPNCRCHIEYIHKTDAEVERDTKRMLRGEKPIEAHESKNFVGELPKSFKDWYDGNKERISRSKTTPYFIEDNENLIANGGVVVTANQFKSLTANQFETYASKMKINPNQRDILYNSDDLYIDSSWAREINAELAKGKFGKTIPKDFMDDIGSRQQVETLDAVIDNNHIPQDMLVYRKVSEYWLNRDGYDFSVGSIINEYGFTSVSSVEGMNVIRRSKNIRLDIIVHKGANAYITENIKESEIIFPRNSKFRVISVSDGKYGKVIKLELLSGK